MNGDQDNNEGNKARSVLGSDWAANSRNPSPTKYMVMSKSTVEGSVEPSPAVNSIYKIDSQNEINSELKLNHKYKTDTVDLGPSPLLFEPSLRKTKTFHVGDKSKKEKPKDPPAKKQESWFQRQKVKCKLCKNAFLQRIKRCQNNFERLIGQIIIRNSDSNKQMWDLVVMMLSLVNTFAVPLQISFKPEFLQSQLFTSINYVIDFLFFIDILISFRTAYMDERGEEETRTYYMAREYIHSTFIIDVLATFPFDLVIDSAAEQNIQNDSMSRASDDSGNNIYIQIFGVLKLGRLLRLNKIIQFLKAEEDLKAGLRVFKLVLFLFVYFHCYTCVWWMLVVQDKVWVPYNIQKGQILWNWTIEMRYLICLTSAVQSTLGNEIRPRDISQTALQCLAIFLGALINANIFGELQVILSQMGRAQQEFKNHLSITNTAMINLRLPQKTQIEVRHQMYRNQPTKEFQKTIQLFFSLISPSLKSKVVASLYRDVLKDTSILCKKEVQMDDLLEMIQITFFESEQVIMGQYDDDFRQIVITGAGSCNVYKYFNGNSRICLGIMYQGHLDGEKSVLFDSDPIISIEAQSYCTVGHIPYEDMLQFFGKYPEIRQNMINQMLSNPYDRDRDDFVKQCKNNIQYFKDLPDDLLCQVYYQCQHRFVYPDELLFNAGENCNAIYFVLDGTIDIEITDGELIYTRLDTLGPGSIMGQNFVLKQEPWYYRAKNNTVNTCSVRYLPQNTLVNLMNSTEELLEHFKQQMEQIETQGLPQIDYIIENQRYSEDQIYDLVKDFKKMQIWKQSHRKNPEKVQQEIATFESKFETYLGSINEMSEIQEILDEYKLFAITQDKIARFQNIMKFGVKSYAGPGEKPVRISDTLRMFQRTIRRLSTLRRFARRINLEFDIENMEISIFHYQGRYNRLKKLNAHVNYENLSPQRFVDTVSDFMQIECFFPLDEVENMQQVTQSNKEFMEKLTKKLERIEKRLPKINIQELLLSDHTLRNKISNIIQINDLQESVSESLQEGIQKVLSGSSSQGGQGYQKYR